jgi:hypothetical protein
VVAGVECRHRRYDIELRKACDLRIGVGRDGSKQAKHKQSRRSSSVCDRRKIRSLRLLINSPAHQRHRMYGAHPVIEAPPEEAVVAHRDQCAETRHVGRFHEQRSNGVVRLADSMTEIAEARGIGLKRTVTLGEVDVAPVIACWTSSWRAKPWTNAQSASQAATSRSVARRTWKRSAAGAAGSVYFEA